MAPPRPAFLVVAWSGAVAFAASLIVFVYCYLVTFGRPVATDSILAPLLTNFLLFSLFALHHSVFARAGVKTLVHGVAPPALERSIYTWAASALFTAVCLTWQPIPGRLYELTGLAGLIAYAAQAVGLVLTIRASRALDVLDLAGVRAVQRAGQATDVPQPALNTHGLYGFVRHPLYFSWALFVFSTPSMTATRAAFAVISTGYLMLAIPFEERGLIDTFGRDYREYQQRVRSRMIPWLY
jgi:protein-S-isoprenylcysteine O-methyltransferase Ste14